MPIGGGEAKALTSGIAWDMQPRYSPDGKWIAFTSDRSGGDNIWVIGRDGKNPQQVTKESFRLPNTPAWTPDSQYIAARKHFTGTRSLGAGEIWLYHRSGGEGLQMTKRANEQKDDRRAGVLARRALPLLVRGLLARQDLPVQPRPERPDLRHQAPRPADGPHRSTS